MWASRFSFRWTRQVSVVYHSAWITYTLLPEHSIFFKIPNWRKKSVILCVKLQLLIGPSRALLPAIEVHPFYSTMLLVVKLRYVLKMSHECQTAYEQGSCLWNWVLRLSYTCLTIFFYYLYLECLNDLDKGQLWPWYTLLFTITYFSRIRRLSYTHELFLGFIETGMLG